MDGSILNTVNFITDVSIQICEIQWIISPGAEMGF